MVSLTHVCRWTESGWIPISALEAIRIFPGGAKVHSDFFRCKLCGQSVGLSSGRTRQSGDKGDPYFYHSSGEAEKNCPERVFGSTISVSSYDPTKYSLPLRIVVTNVLYHFEIGFTCLPIGIMKELRNDSIRIDPKDQNSDPFQYSISDWFLDNKITWLPVGNAPSAGYVISSVCEERLKFYWPSFVQGIDKWGAVFDATSGKMLSQDADVQIEKNYYVLLQGPLTFIPKSVSCDEIVRNYNGTWSLYRVRGLNFSEEVAKFFLRFGCRLTKTPLFIQQVWPLYIEDPYIIRHNKNKLWFYIQGNEIESKSYPPSPQKSFDCGKGQVVQINALGRQQVVSTGRSKMMEYTYLWQDPLNRTTHIPSVSVSTLKDETISPGITDKLPEKRILRILSSQYDGTLSVLQNGVLREKRPIKAGELCEVSSIQFETEIRVSIGLDCICSIIFQKAKNEENLSDAALIRRLDRERGALQVIPHSLGSVAKKLDAHPMVQRWLYRKIRDGFMSRTSYLLLQKWILENSS